MEKNDQKEICEILAMVMILVIEITIDFYAFACILNFHIFHNGT